MKKALMLVLLGALAVAVPLTACWNRGPTAEDPEAVLLKTYVVPREYQHDVRSMLSYALSGETIGGRVAEGPAGTLVVVAPPAVHAGIAGFLRDLGAVEAPLPAPSPITLTYWLLVGRPADASRTPAGGFIVDGADDLSELQPALTQIAASEGPTEFNLLERLRLTSMAHEGARLTGKHARLAQRATKTADGVVAEVEIGFMRMGPDTLESEVILEPGQFLVLGQAGFADKPGVAFDSGDLDRLTLYYVMTADL